MEGLEVDEGREKAGMEETEVVTDGGVRLPETGWVGETVEAEMVPLRAEIGMEGVESSL